MINLDVTDEVIELIESKKEKFDAAFERLIVLGRGGLRTAFNSADKEGEEQQTFVLRIGTISGASHHGFQVKVLLR